MKVKVIEVLGEITNEKLRSWMGAGDEDFEPIELKDGRFLTFVKIANDETFIPSIRIVITDKDPRIKFKCKLWMKDDKFFPQSTSKIGGTLWYDFDSTQAMEKEAQKLIQKDNIVEIRFQKVMREGDILPTYSLTYKEI